MKRFIGYIMLCISILISVFAGFVPTFYNVNYSADYANGREFIYQISERQILSGMDFVNKNSLSKTDENLKDDIDSVVDIFKNRLEVAGISNAVVEKVEANGINDDIYTIRVAYKAQYEQLYDAINEYLTFDWNLSVSMIQEPYNVSQYNDSDKAQLFEPNSATLDTSSGSPIIKMKIADPSFFYNSVFKKVHTEATEEETASEVEGEGEGEEQGPTNSDYIYIVNNWKNEYKVEEAVGSNSSSYYSDAVNNIVYKLNTKDPATMFEGYDESSESEDGYDTILIDYSQFIPESLNSITDPAIIQRLIISLANIEVNKLNSESLNYQVTLLNSNFPANGTTSNVVPSFIEQLRSHGNLTMSLLLISTLIAFALTFMFMALNYGIASLAAIGLTSGTVLGSAALLSLFGVEFNIGTILALLVIALISIFSSAIYFNKVKEGLYNGKQLKKANSDAGKSTFFYHLDISIIILILGIVAYLSKNTVIMSIGAIFITGSFINFFASVFVLKGLYWLLANSSYVEQHLGLIRVDKKEIPDLSKDEKPTYFEKFKINDETNKNKKLFNKRSLITSIVLGVLLIGSIIAIPTVGAIKGNIYGANTSDASNTQIVLKYVATEGDNVTDGFATTEQLDEFVLSKISYRKANDEDGELTKISYNKDNIKGSYYTFVDNKDGNTKYDFTYIINLNEIYDENNDYFFNNDLTKKYDLTQLFTDILDGKVEGIDAVDNLNVYVGTVYNYTDDTLSLSVLYFALIGVAFTTLYTLIRYGLTRGLLSLVLVGGVSTISVGLYSILQTGSQSTNTLGIIAIIGFIYALILYYFNKEKQALKDSKNSIVTLEDRNKVISESHNMTFFITLAPIGLVFIVFVSYFISSTFRDTCLFMVFVGIFIALLAITTLLEPSEKIGYNGYLKAKASFNKISEKHKEKRRKNKKHNNDKGDGPQESVIIGIND